MSESGHTHRKKSRRAAIAITTVVVAAVVAFSVFFIGGFGDDDEPVAEPTTTASSSPTTTKPTKEAEPEPKGKAKAKAQPSDEGASPGELQIPSLDVSASVVPIEHAGNELDPPADAQKVGWWSAGARPGAETGSALLTGHTLSSGHGALQDLENASAGDRVAVKTDSGKVTYEVTNVVTLSKDELAAQAEQLFDQTVPGRLVVVTCEDFNGEDYLSNVVLTAEPVS